MKSTWKIIEPPPGSGPFAVARMSGFRFGEVTGGQRCCEIEVLKFTDVAWLVIGRFCECAEGIQ